MRRLDRQVAGRITEALARLAQTGRGDILPLRGTRDEWRLRVGDWRVRIQFDHDAHTIVVLHVLPRGRAYRD